MAFLFASLCYLLAILFYSVSHCLPIERAEGFKAAAPTFNVLCNRFQLVRSQKLICLLCKGFDPSCLLPLTTPYPTSTTPSTTTASTSPTSTTPPTTTTVTTTQSQIEE